MECDIVKLSQTMIIKVPMIELNQLLFVDCEVKICTAFAQNAGESGACTQSRPSRKKMIWRNHDQRDNLNKDVLCGTRTRTHTNTLTHTRTHHSLTHTHTHIQTDMHRAAESQTHSHK